jgi:hypothetical protein
LVYGINPFVGEMIVGKIIGTHRNMLSIERGFTEDRK